MEATHRIHILFSVWGETRSVQASIRLERALQGGHQAVGTVTVASLQSVSGFVTLRHWSDNVAG